MFLLTNQFFIVGYRQASFLSKCFKENNFEGFPVSQRPCIILPHAVTYMPFAPTNTLQPKEKWVVL